MTHSGLRPVVAMRGATVTIGCGLWHPLGVAPVKLVAGLPFIRDRKDGGIHV